MNRPPLMSPPLPPSSPPLRNPRARRLLPTQPRGSSNSSSTSDLRSSQASGSGEFSSSNSEACDIRSPPQEPAFVALAALPTFGDDGHDADGNYVSSPKEDSTCSVLLLSSTDTGTDKLRSEPSFGSLPSSSPRHLVPAMSNCSGSPLSPQLRRHCSYAAKPPLTSQATAAERISLTVAADPKSRQQMWAVVVSIAKIQRRLLTANSRQTRRVCLSKRYWPLMQLLARRWLRRVRVRLALARTDPISKPSLGVLQKDPCFATLYPSASYSTWAAVWDRMKLKYVFPGELVMSQWEPPPVSTRPPVFVVASGSFQSLAYHGTLMDPPVLEVGSVVGSLEHVSRCDRLTTVIAGPQGGFVWECDILHHERDEVVGGGTSNAVGGELDQVRRRNVTYAFRHTILDVHALRAFRLLQPVSNVTALVAAGTVQYTRRGEALLTTAHSGGGFLLVLCGVMSVRWVDNTPCHAHSRSVVASEEAANSTSSTATLSDLLSTFVQVPAQAPQTLKLFNQRGKSAAVAKVVAPALVGLSGCLQLQKPRDSRPQWSAVALTPCESLFVPRAVLLQSVDLIELDDMRRACAALSQPSPCQHHTVTPPPMTAATRNQAILEGPFQDPSHLKILMAWLSRETFDIPIEPIRSLFPSETLTHHGADDEWAYFLFESRENDHRHDPSSGKWRMWPDLSVLWVHHIRDKRCGAPRSEFLRIIALEAERVRFPLHLEPTARITHTAAFRRGVLDHVLFRADAIARSAVVATLLHRLTLLPKCKPTIAHKDRGPLLSRSSLVSLATSTHNVSSSLSSLPTSRRMETDDIDIEGEGEEGEEEDIFGRDDRCCGDASQPRLMRGMRPRATYSHHQSSDGCVGGKEGGGGADEVEMGSRMALTNKSSMKSIKSLKSLAGSNSGGGEPPPLVPSHVASPWLTCQPSPPSATSANGHQTRHSSHLGPVGALVRTSLSTSASSQHNLPPPPTSSLQLPSSLFTSRVSSTTAAATTTPPTTKSFLRSNAQRPLSSSSDLSSLTNR